MRYYTGQRFVATFAGERHAVSIVEAYEGGPVEARVDAPAGGIASRFPTWHLTTLLEAGAAVPAHSCMRPDAHTPAYVLAERCARCQQTTGAGDPGHLASLVAGK